MIEAGLPDSAFKPIQGDDKKSCSELRKRNKTEREYGQRDFGLVADSEDQYDSLAARSRSIDHAPDGTLDDIRRKDAQFRRMQESEDYRRAQQVADAWCAAFVWPKRPGAPDALTTDTLRPGDAHDQIGLVHGAPDALTTDTLRRLRENSNALAAAQQEETERIADAYQFFHWHLAFSEVFASGGFDCVLGNPPWEHTELKEKEWFAGRHTGIVNARTGAERKRLIAALQREDPSLYASYADALREHDGLSQLLRNTGRFPRAARGRINLYAVFAEGMRNLVNDRGRAGCVLPTGIATDDSTKILFQDVVETGSLVSLFDFENKGVFFPGVHSSYKFCLFTTGNGSVPMSDLAEFVFFAHAVEELHDPERRFTLSPDDIALLNPNTRTCAIFRSRKDAELTKAIYRRVPVLCREASNGNIEENPWGIRFRQGLFNMTSDSGIFRSRSDLEASGWKLKGNVFQKNGEEYLPLYEAKMIHQFDHRWASYSEADTKDVADDVPLSAKQSPAYAALPRHWVEAREVYLRCAELPKGLLSALRTRDTSLIVLGVVHLLFAHRLRQISGGSASAVLTTLFAAWIEFVERHPLARRLAPTQMGLCGNNPGTLPANWMELSTVAAREPPTVDLLTRVAPGPDYLPARPLDDVQVGSRNTTLWYSADETIVSDTLDLAAQYRHVFERMPDVRDEDDALTCAERWLRQDAPRWLLGVRDITNSTNERTVVSSVFPLSAVGHNLPVWTASAKQPEVLPALLSSLACDFAARLKVGGTHLSFFIAKQIAVLAPEVVDQPALWGYPGESVRDWLMPRILELTYGTWDLEPFARDCNWDGPPFRWDEKRRFLMRCELDAAVFHRYLPADECGKWQPPRHSRGHNLDETSGQLAEVTHYFSTPRMRSATSWTRSRSFAVRTRRGTGIIAPNE